MNLNSFWTVSPKPFSKSIIPKSSKSHANRILILASLSPNDIRIHNTPKAEDVLVLIHVLRKLGLRILEDGDSLLVSGSFPACEKKSDSEVVLETGEGGTTNRFLFPLLLLGRNKYRLKTTGRFHERPLDDFIDVLRGLGAQINQEGSDFILQGPLMIREGQNVEIDCSKTTQHASAILMALRDQIDLLPLNLKSSTRYFLMTQYYVEEFKKGVQEFYVPADFSSLSYPIALAALSGSVYFPEVFKIDPFQSDSLFIDYLYNIGAKVSWERGGLRVEQGALKSFELDCSLIPDLIPTLAFMASFISGESTLKNIKALKYKESDRLEAVQELLTLFGIDHSYNDVLDLLKITGRKPLSVSVEYHPPRDHRMVMAGYLFMRLNGGGRLYQSDCVSKSYPEFFEDME